MRLTSDSPEINIGTRVTFTGHFTDEDGAAKDPTSVTAWARRPDGTMVSPAPVASSAAVVGDWDASVLIDQSGRWYVGMQGFGNVEAANETAFEVPPTRKVV